MMIPTNDKIIDSIFHFPLLFECSTRAKECDVDKWKKGKTGRTNKNDAS